MRMTKTLLAASVGAALATALPTAASAGGVKFEDGDKYLKIGGRIQLQYHQTDFDNGDSEDEVRFRRFRPYIEGSAHPDWKGKFQWDMGKASGDNEISVKDAYMQYKGIDNMKLTLGNANFPFSREFLTSSKRQQLVERTFVGDHNYGTPDRNVGLHITGNSGDKKITYGLSAGSSSIDPDVDKLDFDSPINKKDDFNEGWIVGGRVDFHPFGKLKMAQGDMSGDTKATIGVAAFNWNNDDDNNSYTDSSGVTTSAGKADMDSVTGMEISGAFRAAGFSVDAQYNLFDAETVDTGFSGGLYENGETELTNYAVEGGYMVVPSRFEIVAGYQGQDADNYETEWERTSVGANWFIKKHDIKAQLTYRMGENIDGVKDDDADEIYLQTQYVF